MITKVAVYGTLKRSYHNHTLLGNSKFIGYKNYTGLMFHMGGYPGVVLGEDVHPDHVCHKFVNNYTIACELYEVDGPTLQRLDRLEGHPDWYYRTPMLDPAHGEVHIYTQRATRQLHGVKKCIPGGFWYGDVTSIMDVQFYDGTQKPKILCWRGGTSPDKPRIIVPQMFTAREEEPKGRIVKEKEGIAVTHKVHPFHDDFDDDVEDAMFDDIAYYQGPSKQSASVETVVDLTELDQVKEA